MAPAPAPVMNPLLSTVDDAALMTLAANALGAVLLALAEEQGLGLAIKDARDGRYLHADRRLGALFGIAPEAWIGRSDAELFDAAIVTALRAADQTALGHGAVLRSDHRLEWHGERRDFGVWRQVATGDGERRWLVCLWQDNAPARQREAQMRGALAQLEQEQKANALLRREAAEQGPHDPASGLYARAHFEDQIRREVDLSMREHREFALVHIALDAFAPKVAAAGERARVRVGEAMGRLLRGNTRAMDAACRIDELQFAVLLSGVGLATAHARMEGLRRQCATQIVALDGEELGFTVSMGVASFPHTAHTQADVIAASVAALREAQRRGGNTVALAAIRFEPGT